MSSGLVLVVWPRRALTLRAPGTDASGRAEGERLMVGIGGEHPADSACFYESSGENQSQYGR